MIRPVPYRSCFREGIKFAVFSWENVCWTTAHICRKISQDLSMAVSIAPRWFIFVYPIVGTSAPEIILRLWHCENIIDRTIEARHCAIYCSRISGNHYEGTHRDWMVHLCPIKPTYEICNGKKIMTCETINDPLEISKRFSVELLIMRLNEISGRASREPLTVPTKGDIEAIVCWFFVASRNYCGAYSPNYSWISRPNHRGESRKIDGTLKRIGDACLHQTFDCAFEYRRASLWNYSWHILKTANHQHACKWILLHGI